MKPFKKSGAAAAAAMAVLVALLLTASAAHSQPLTAPPCKQLGELKRVFPAANAVGFTRRSGIKTQQARAPVFPGRCGAFWTTYTSPNGEGMDVGVTLYKTATDVSAPLAEPAAGVMHVLLNGARVRYSGPDPLGVNGTPASETFAASAFRRLFISSISISTSMRPVPISEQLRLHRRIEHRFARLVAGLHTGGSTAAPPWPVCLAIYPIPGDLKEELVGNVCGPRRVIPGVNYSFTVVVTNASTKTLHPFTLHISHYDPFTRTSRPYRRETARNGDLIMKGAAWTVKRLRPLHSLRISFTLPFRRHHDAKGSNFDVYLVGTHDVVFVKP